MQTQAHIDQLDIASPLLGIFSLLLIIIILFLITIRLRRRRLGNHHHLSILVWSHNHFLQLLLRLVIVSSLIHGTLLLLVILNQRVLFIRIVSIAVLSIERHRSMIAQHQMAGIRRNGHCHHSLLVISRHHRSLRSGLQHNIIDIGSILVGDRGANLHGIVINDNHVICVDFLQRVGRRAHMIRFLASVRHRFVFIVPESTEIDGEPTH
mmetsp:Transcript_46146/g.73954  ORF Transcript_46146/g.73954 Transcript_46146/m.73954 type:complete len:209 (+) Transcript_46146:346-972(+)